MENLHIYPLYLVVGKEATIRRVSTPSRLPPSRRHTSPRLLLANTYVMSAVTFASPAMMAAPAASARPTARNAARVTAAKAPAGLGAKAVLPARHGVSGTLGVSSKPQLAGARRR